MPVGMVSGDEEHDGDPLVGRVLGKGYQLVKRLGGGGFGAVYRAIHPDTGKVLAAKVLRVDRAALSAEARTRFRREARALVSLRHPRIVAIHGHGTSEDGLEYLLMDLLEGEDLSEHLARRHRVPFVEALALFDQMAEAVQYAHDMGIAHRDLKPANVFLRLVEGGLEPVVLDFGLAKMVEGSEESLTATGMVLGTPHYMAPEQATGEHIDRRVDVYALGCIFYEMLTGQPPFTGNTPTAILMKMLTSPPPAMSTGLGVPTAIEEAVRCALAKNPDERFLEVSVFREAVTAAAKSIPLTRMIPALPSSPPPTREAPAVSTGAAIGPMRRYWPVTGLMSLLLLLTGGLVIWASTRGGAPVVIPSEPTRVASAPADEAVPRARDQELDRSADTRSMSSGVDRANAEEARVGAPPVEVPAAPPEADPTAPTSPARDRSRSRLRSGATALPSSDGSSSNAVDATGATAAGPAAADGHEAYAEEVRRLEQKLDETERTGATVAATRRGIESLGRAREPTFCARPTLSASTDQAPLVAVTQSLRSIRERACEPFASVRNPPERAARQIRQISSTLDRARRMAADRSISSNQPADLADQVLAAVDEARQELAGVEEGNRPFPCGSAVFARLRTLSRGANSYAGAAAGRVAQLQSIICGSLGVDPQNLRQLEQRLSSDLDGVEGRLHAHERTLQTSLRARRALLE